jgi:CPA2 family monovalent cation:H+ antiporter-2
MVAARSIIGRAKHVNSAVEVVARALDPSFLPIFRELGVTNAVLPEFEAGLEMTRQSLLHLHIPPPEILMHMETLRRELFAPFFEEGRPYASLVHLRTAERHFDLQWVPLLEGSPLVSRSLGEAALRKTTGASVVGVLRDGKLAVNPNSDFRFRCDDLVAIIGAKAARRAFQELAVPATGPADASVDNPGEG